MVTNMEVAAPCPPRTQPRPPRRMTSFGVGPRIALFTLPYLALAIVLHVVWPGVFLMTDSFHPAFVAVGASLGVIGLALWAGGGRVIDRAFTEGRLLTTGAYAIVRNPMYSGFIVFLLPGISLALRSWILLSTAAVAYLIFRVLIRKEEEYLLGRFGQEFLDYRRRVTAIIPCPRRLFAAL